MKPTCIYISLSYESYQYDRIMQNVMLQDSGRSRVIACHSREKGNILLYYYHLKNINGGKEKRRPGRDMVWVLVGVRGCVLWPTGHSSITLFPCLCRLRTGRCISHRGKSQIYYPKHILVYGRLEDLLLSCRGFGSFWTNCQSFILMEEILVPH